METYKNEGIINYEVGGRKLPIRVEYTATKEKIKVRINYLDLVAILKATKSKNLKELDLLFLMQIRFTDGEIHQIKLTIPEEILNASPEELEERSKQ